MSDPNWTTPYQQAVQPHTQPPKRDNFLWIFGIITVAIGATFAGFMLGWTTTRVTTEPKQIPAQSVQVTAACMTFAEKADHLNDLSNQVIGYAAEGFGAVADGNYDEVTSLARKIGDMTPGYHQAQRDYDTAKSACLGK